MAETSNILAALFIVGIFLSALIFVEVDRLNQAAKSTRDMETFAEEKRLEQSLDALLEIVEPKTGETIGEIIANYSYYGPGVRKYGTEDVDDYNTLKELFDSFYGEKNYYLNIPDLKIVAQPNVEIHFIMDTSGSMDDDFVKIGNTIDYINNSTGKTVRFYVHGLTKSPSIWFGGKCALSNVSCDTYTHKELISKLPCNYDGTSEFCSVNEAWGSGVAVWASKSPKTPTPDINRILIPASDEPSGGETYHVFGNANTGIYSGVQTDEGLKAIQSHKNVYIYPMFCEITNHPYAQQAALVTKADMHKMANATAGQLIDFSSGYSQTKLDTIIKQIIVKYSSPTQSILELGTKRIGNFYDTDKFCFERLVMKPDHRPFRFTFCVYKNRQPHQVQVKRYKMPPIAVITYTPKKLLNQPYTVTLSGLASYDPDGGQITKYEWEIDGTPAGGLDQFQHTFTTTGNHTVKLTVTDDEGNTGTTQITICVGPQCAGLITSGPTPTPTPLPPGGTYQFIFVPVNWAGNTAQFNSTVDAHFAAFINGAEIQSCPNQPTKQAIDPAIGNCSIPDLKTCMCGQEISVLNQIKACAQQAGYTYNKANMRIVGITSDNICIMRVGPPTCSQPTYGVLGYTYHWGDYAVIGEAPYSEVSPHELGHTFFFGDQYSQSEWIRQNKEATYLGLGGCKNYYPDGTTHCQAYGSLTTNCPEYAFNGSTDCRGRKIPVGSQTGRSIMGPGGLSVPRLFDCFEQDWLKKVFNCP